MLRKCQNERTSEGVRAMVSFFIAYLFDFTHRTNEHNSPRFVVDSENTIVVNEAYCCIRIRHITAFQSIGYVSKGINTCMAAKKDMKMERSMTSCCHTSVLLREELRVKDTSIRAVDRASLPTQMVKP